MFRSVFVDGHVAWLIQSRGVINRIDGDGEGAGDRGIVAGDGDVSIESCIRDDNCDHRSAAHVGHRSKFERPGGIGGGVNDGGIRDQRSVAAGGCDAQLLRFTTAGRDAGEVHCLFCRILVNRDIPDGVERRIIVHCRDSDGECNAVNDVVGSGFKLAVAPAVFDVYGDHCRATLICHRLEFQCSGCIGSAVGDGWIGDQTRIVACGCDTDRLEFERTGADFSEVHGLFGRVFRNGDIRNRRDRRRIIQRTHGERECLASESIILGSAQIAVEPAISDGNGNLDGSVRIWKRLEVDAAGRIGRRVSDGGVGNNVRVTAGGHDHQRLALICASGDSGEIERGLT